MIAGLAINPWSVAALLSPDGRFGSSAVIAAVVAFELLVVGFGLVTIGRGKTAWITNLNLFLWTIGVGIPLGGEVAFRVGIALKSPLLRNPGLYAGYSNDDDYWILQQRWDSSYRHASPEQVHPTLGWSQSSVTETNPLGLDSTPRARLASAEPKLLFFGDSFVRGVADDSFELPEYLEDRLPGVDVVDLSVGGYGLDQIYLMFEAFRERHPGGPLLVGMLVDDDLDRTALSVRTSQKPWFYAPDSGGLVLRGVPIETDQATYFRERGLRRKSLFLAFLRTRIGTDERLEVKQKVSAELLRRFGAAADSAGSEIVFVLFYGLPGLLKPSWQESFLRSTLARGGRHVFDTKPVLLGHTTKAGIDPRALYQEGDGHHNNLGNQVIGDGLLAFLTGRGIAGGSLDRRTRPPPRKGLGGGG